VNFFHDCGSVVAKFGATDFASHEVRVQPDEELTEIATKDEIKMLIRRGPAKEKLCLD
jgi:hypothetical protein